jgi:hypothetical protein
MKGVTVCGVHAAALMRSFGIVFDKVVIENGLHLFKGLEPGATALDAEMLVEQGAVPALDDAIVLWPVDPGSLVLDVFELQKQFIGVTVLAAAELAAVVGEHGVPRKVRRRVL